MEIVLKPAQESDTGFVNTLTRSSMKPYVDATWEDEKQREHYYYINRFQLANTFIIYYKKEKAGRMTITEKDHQTIILEELHLLPEYQSKGIGSLLIKQVLDKAKAESKSVYLIVLKTNPAKQLYERLGFKVIEETPERYYMQT